jgi:hypothetical protein
METRRALNPAMPRALVWAQLALYVEAIYAVGHGFAQLRFPGWEILLGSGQLLAAYGIANEGRWAWRLGIAAGTAGLLPPLHELVLAPSLLAHPDFLVLLIVPVVVFCCLVEPSARDYQRAWFR